jgi:hypothetical protein
MSSTLGWWIAVVGWVVVAWAVARYARRSEAADLVVAALAACAGLVIAGASVVYALRTAPSLRAGVLVAGLASAALVGLWSDRRRRRRRFKPSGWRVYRQHLWDVRAVKLGRWFVQRRFARSGGTVGASYERLYTSASGHLFCYVWPGDVDAVLSLSVSTANVEARLSPLEGETFAVALLKWARDPHYAAEAARVRLERDREFRAMALATTPDE